MSAHLLRKSCGALGRVPRLAQWRVILVFSPDPSFVLEPNFDFHALIELRPDRLQLGGEVFLKASTANAFCA
jgi:hypothetical protein